MILYGQPDGIYRVPADGGPSELIIPAEEGEILYGPELMPDGDSVLFSALTAGATNFDNAQVAVQSLSNGERTVLISGGNDAHYMPTGHLVYALGDGLFAVAFDTAARSVSGGAVSLVQGLARIGASPSRNYGIADDGTLVYLNVDGLLTAAVTSTPVWVDRDGKEDPLGLECLCGSPGVSPDGTRVAFQEVNREISQSDIWLWSLTQRAKTRLTLESGLHVGPVWSPDSTRIAYSSIGEGIFARSADGTGTPELLLPGSNAVVWDWPQDDELIFTDGGDIGVLSLTGERQRRPLLATTNVNEYRPAVSPDGRWIAYESDKTGQLEIFVRPFPDVDAGEWLVSSGGGQEPDWSPDDRTLFYFGPTSVMEAAIGDGPAFTFEAPRPTFDRARYNSPGSPPRTYAVSPDGQRFLMWRSAPAEAAAGGNFQIIVVQNWVEELKRRVPTE